MVGKFLLYNPNLQKISDGCHVVQIVTKYYLNEAANSSEIFTIHRVRNVELVTLNFLPVHYFAHSPYCYYRAQEI